MCRFHISIQAYVALSGVGQSADSIYFYRYALDRTFRTNAVSVSVASDGLVVSFRGMRGSIQNPSHFLAVCLSVYMNSRAVLSGVTV